ncbi:hypothetical protein ACYBSK_25570 [Streptomyces sp. BYX5S]
MTHTTSADPDGSVKYGYEIQQSALRQDCDVWFATPPGFVEIPIAALFAEPGSPEAARTVEAVNALLALVPEDKRADFLTQLGEARTLSGLMLEEGVVHVAIGAHEGDDGEMISSVLTITSKETPFSPPKLAAVRAATKRESAVPVAVVDLPCGPGAFTETVVEVPAEVAPGRPSLYEVTAYLPYPGGQGIVVLTLTTTAVEAREHYRDIHRGIAHMVSFDNPLPGEITEQIAESDVAASVRTAFG